MPSSVFLVLRVPRVARGAREQRDGHIPLHGQTWGKEHQGLG